MKFLIKQNRECKNDHNNFHIVHVIGNFSHSIAVGCEDRKIQIDSYRIEVNVIRIDCIDNLRFKGNVIFSPASASSVACYIRMSNTKSNQWEISHANKRKML